MIDPDRPRAAIGSFPYPARTVAAADVDERWSDLLERAHRRVYLALPLSLDMKRALEAERQARAA